MRVDNCFICKKEYRVDCGSYEDEVFFCLECIKWTSVWFGFDDITFEEVDGEIEL